VQFAVSQPVPLSYPMFVGSLIAVIPNEIHCPCELAQLLAGCGILDTVRISYI
jgi:hypothetical protein